MSVAKSIGVPHFRLIMCSLPIFCFSTLAQFDFLLPRRGVCPFGDRILRFPAHSSYA